MRVRLYLFEMKGRMIKLIYYSTETRKANYLLRKWKFYLNCENKLNETHQKNKALLLEGLKKLSKEEKEFLAEKYLNRIGGQPITDQVLSERKGMKKEAYKKKRVAVELKLSKFIELETHELS